MSFSIRMVPEPIRQLATASLTSSYKVIGGPLLHAARIIAFKNNSSTSIYFSFNNIDDHVYLAPGENFTLDIMANGDLACFLSKGTQFYVKDDGVAAAAGSQISIIVLHGIGE